MFNLNDFKYNCDTSRLDVIKQSLSAIQSLPVNESLLMLDSHASATIEGARTTIDEIQKAITSGSFNKDTLMCVNTFKAYNLLNTVNNLTEDSLLNTWHVIVDGCCENISAGSTGYRTGMVYVGSFDKIIHVPALPEDIPTMMKDLLNFTSGDFVLDSILIHFFLVYIHPFCDGNGRLARALSLWKLNNFNLPLAKSINLNLHGYYNAIKYSEDLCDVTPFIDYMFLMYENACYLYTLLANDLSDNESMLLRKMDRTGKGKISVSKTASMLNVSVDTAVTILRDLELKGYLEYCPDGWKLLWR